MCVCVWVWVWARLIFVCSWLEVGGPLKLRPSETYLEGPPIPCSSDMTTLTALADLQNHRAQLNGQLADVNLKIANITEERARTRKSFWLAKTKCLSSVGPYLLASPGLAAGLLVVAQPESTRTCSSVAIWSLVWEVIAVVSIIGQLVVQTSIEAWFRQAVVGMLAAAGIVSTIIELLFASSSGCKHLQEQVNVVVIVFWAFSLVLLACWAIQNVTPASRIRWALAVTFLGMPGFVSAISGANLNVTESCPNHRAISIVWPLFVFAEVLVVSVLGGSNDNQEFHFAVVYYLGCVSMATGAAAYLWSTGPGACVALAQGLQLAVWLQAVLCAGFGLLFLSRC